MFSKNLTQSLKKSLGWSDLVKAVSEVNGTAIEPLIERAKTLTSYMTMNKKDLDIRLNELGAFLTFGSVAEEDRPLVIQQRIDEIPQKGFLYPIDQTLGRELGRRNITWQALYAPVDQDKYPYGNLFATERQKVFFGDVDEWFLTYRGVIESPINEFYFEAGGDAERAEELVAQFQNGLDRLVIPLIPVEIVLHGQVFTISFSVTEVRECARVTSRALSLSLAQANLRKDIVSISNRKVTTNFKIPVQAVDFSPERLTMDSIPLDSWPMDQEVI